MSPEKSPEDEYFAREEIEKHHKLAKEIADRRSAAEAEALKKAHWRKCPNCGNDLQAFAYQHHNLLRCFHCHGTFLSEGELEKLAPVAQHRILEAIVNVFKRSDKD